MFSLLNNTHTFIHFHANNGCLMQTIDGIKLPHVFELTYIRNDFIVNKIRNTQPLPTPIDIINVLNKPDFFLKDIHIQFNINIIYITKEIDWSITPILKLCFNQFLLRFPKVNLESGKSK